MRITLFLIIACLVFSSCSQGMKNGKTGSQDLSADTSAVSGLSAQKQGEATQNQDGKKGAAKNTMLNSFTRNTVNSDLVPFRNSQNPKDKEAEALYNSGTVKSKDGDYAGAVSDFTRSISMSPYGNTYLRRGYAYLMLKEYDKGIEDMNLAMKLLPTPELAWFARGICYFEKENFDSAEEDIRKYLEKVKSNPLAYNYMAAIKFMKQDIQGALDNYDIVAKMNPDFKDIYTNRGMMRQYMNDMKGAVEDYNEAIKRDPGNATAFNNRGAAKMSQKDYEGALKDFNEAVSLKVGYADAYDNRGRAKLKLGNTPGACEDWQKAYSLGMEKSRELIEKYCK
jgi:tetratricopeptide (TPR) repeat protein